mmetsp:Transcript_136006/g.235939  ORF Transcript_136006/g.235939 Transcript_136006/m.235939 type:complete len:865 (-) Transcript_136006:849-3443(-)
MLSSSSAQRYYSIVDVPDAVDDLTSYRGHQWVAIGCMVSAGLALILAATTSPNLTLGLFSSTHQVGARSPVVPVHQAPNHNFGQSSIHFATAPRTKLPGLAAMDNRVRDTHSYGPTKHLVNPKVSNLYNLLCGVGAFLLMPIAWIAANNYTRRNPWNADVQCMAAVADQPQTKPRDPTAFMDSVRGNTLGAALVLEEADISVGSNQLLEGVNFKIMPNERWGIVGPNGTGKSTLLKAITGQDPVKLASGRLVLHPTFRVGYLEQKGVSGSTATVREEVASRMDRVQKAKAALEEAEARIMEMNPDDVDAMTDALNVLADAQSEFELAGGYDVDAKVARVLKGLGFKEEDYDRSCTSFSGGWQMRIALARLLLSEPELLILDEPTNHLDAAAKKWIAEYLSQYKGTVLIVSHDENLLRRATSSIAEVRNKKLDLYKSRSFDQWGVEREEREARAIALWERQEEEIARLQTFVDKYGASATKASAAQSRVKMIEKLRAEQIEKPTGVKTFRPKLNLPPPPPCYEEQLELTDAAFGWGEKPIVTGVSLRIDKGFRIVVRGPNGAGKSTMLRALSGDLPLKSGKRREGEGLKLGFFQQDLAQELPQDKIAVDVVQMAGLEHNPLLTARETRTTMGALGLSGDKSIREIGYLSGGEKARVALARFALVPHNLLLLDEPSNHLDIETVESLTDALKSFKGAVVVVSHDRNFCESLGCTHVITVEDGKAVMEERELTDADWLEDDMSAQAQECVEIDGEEICVDIGPALAKPNPPGLAAKPAHPGAEAPKPELTGEQKKERINAERQMRKLENRFESLEKKLAPIQEEMALPANASNLEKLLPLQQKVDKLEADMAAILEEMEELDQILAA